MCIFKIGYFFNLVTNVLNISYASQFNITSFLENGIQTNSIVHTKKLMSCIVAESFQHYLIKVEKEEIDKRTSLYLQMSNTTEEVRN